VFDFSKLAQWVQVIGYLLALLTIAPLFPFLYLVLRWRSGTGTRAAAGTYGAMLYFASIAWLITLAGGANLLYGAIASGETDPELTRYSWALCLAGAAFLALHSGLVRLLPERAALAEARRVFAGFLMTLSGMVAIGALVLLLGAVFHVVDDAQAGQAAERTRAMQLYACWTTLFLLDYVVLAWRLARGAAAR